MLINQRLVFVQITVVSSHVHRFVKSDINFVIPVCLSVVL